MVSSRATTSVWRARGQCRAHARRRSTASIGNPTTLVNDPVILLADEPTGNLDPVASREILGIFDKVNRRGTACIIATHDYSLIAHRPGRVIKIMNKNFYDVV